MFGFRKQVAAPMPATLADEATAAVGHHDALRARSRTALEKYRERLSIQVKRGMEALAAIDAVLDREMAIETAEKVEAAQADVERAIEEIDLDLDGYDPADDARKSYEYAIQVKRERGDTEWPTRASEEAKPDKHKRRAGKALAAVEV